MVGEAVNAEEIAKAFHEAYERLAPSFSYETRKASAVPWEQVPENNRQLMIAVAGEVAPLIAAQVLQDAADLVNQRIVAPLGLACPSCGARPGAAAKPLVCDNPIHWPENGRELSLVEPVRHVTRCGPCDSLRCCEHCGCHPGRSLTEDAQ